MLHSELVDHNQAVFERYAMNGSWVGFRYAGKLYNGIETEYDWWWEVSHKNGNMWILKQGDWQQEASETDLMRQFIFQLVSERRNK